MDTFCRLELQSNASSLPSRHDRIMARMGGAKAAKAG